MKFDEQGKVIFSPGETIDLSGFRTNVRNVNLGLPEDVAEGKYSRVIPNVSAYGQMNLDLSDEWSEGTPQPEDAQLYMLLRGWKITGDMHPNLDAPYINLLMSTATQTQPGQDKGTFTESDTEIINNTIDDRLKQFDSIQSGASSPIIPDSGSMEGKMKGFLKQKTSLDDGVVISDEEQTDIDLRAEWDSYTEKDQESFGTFEDFKRFALAKAVSPVESSVLPVSGDDLTNLVELQSFIFLETSPKLYSFIVGDISRDNTLFFLNKVKPLFVFT